MANKILEGWDQPLWIHLGNKWRKQGIYGYGSGAHSHDQVIPHEINTTNHGSQL